MSRKQPSWLYGPVGLPVGPEYLGYQSHSKIKYWYNSSPSVLHFQHHKENSCDLVPISGLLDAVAIFLLS